MTTKQRKNGQLPPYGQSDEVVTIVQETVVGHVYPDPAGMGTVTEAIFATIGEKVSSDGTDGGEGVYRAKRPDGRTLIVTVSSD